MAEWLLHCFADSMPICMDAIELPEVSITGIDEVLSVPAVMTS